MIQALFHPQINPERFCAFPVDTSHDWELLTSARMHKEFKSQNGTTLATGQTTPRPSIRGVFLPRLSAPVAFSCGYQVSLEVNPVNVLVDRLDRQRRDA